MVGSWSGYDVETISVQFIACISDILATSLFWLNYRYRCKNITLFSYNILLLLVFFCA